MSLCSLGVNVEFVSVAIPPSKSALSPLTETCAPSAQQRHADLRRRIGVLEQYTRTGADVPARSDGGGDEGLGQDAGTMIGTVGVAGGVESQMNAIWRELAELNARLAAQERTEQLPQYDALA